MATTIVKEYYPHAGLVWSRTIDLLVIYLTTVGMGFAWEVATEGGYYRVMINLTVGADTTSYRLIDLDHPVGEFYSFGYFFTLPGIFKSPPVLPKERGTFQTILLWDIQAQLLRALFVETLLNCTYTFLDGEDLTVANPPTIMRTLIARVRKALHIGVDQVSCATAGDGADPGYIGTQPDFQGAPMAPPMMIVGGGGGTVDTAPIVAALNDIALIDVDYTANNGGTVFSLRGKVRST